MTFVAIGAIRAKTGQCHSVFCMICLYFRENYLFSCQCSRCLSQADDPDITSEEEDEELDSEDPDMEDCDCC